MYLHNYTLYHYTVTYNMYNLPKLRLMQKHADKFTKHINNNVIL